MTQENCFSARPHILIQTNKNKKREGEGRFLEVAHTTSAYLPYEIHHAIALTFFPYFVLIFHLTSMVPLSDFIVPISLHHDYYYFKHMV